MKGFFTKQETQSLTRPDGKTYSCASCGLLHDAHTPRMEPYGNFKKSILILSNMPSKGDDSRGKPWQGTVGRFLKQELGKLGVDLFEDCLSTFAMRCHSPKTIKTYEVACCRRNVLKVIQDMQPKVILLLGDAAVDSVIGGRFKKEMGSIHKWRGWTIPDQEMKSWLCPMMHPSHVDNANKEILTIWRQDLERALGKLEIPFPRCRKPKIKYLEDDISALSTITEGMVAIDYETTGIKPHGVGHRIICASVAISPDEAYTFMMPKTKKARRPFIELLANPRVEKIAQNMKFEEAWSVVRLKQPVMNWVWDTMLASHILDNRTGTTGLKFQTYVQFGVIDYDSEVNPFLRAEDEKNANSINRIEQLAQTESGRKMLLEYCALDTIYEYRLAMQQIDRIGYDFLPF